MASSTLIIAILLLVTVAHASDPTCATGVKAAGACCPAGCGQCGGPDCGPRGRSLGLKCCIGAIKNMDANCLTSNPPCKITTRDPDFMAGSDVADPKCEMGLRKNMACCPPECSTCGGSGCRRRGALIKSMCCPAEIRAGTRSCMDTGAPCSLKPVMEEPMESPMEPMETPMMPVETPMVPVETPMVPMETPDDSTPEPLPRFCTRMRNKFIGGCFCYLIFSDKLDVKKERFFRKFCRTEFGNKPKILSLGFACRRFRNGPKAAARVETIIKKLNRLIPDCAPDLPMIEVRM